MLKYILKDHIPIEEPDILKWAQWYEEFNNRVLKKDKIGELRISTVFLGIDHRLFDEGPPILFETMIFGGQHDKYQERYTSWDEALEGHRVALELVRNELH